MSAYEAAKNAVNAAWVTASVASNVVAGAPSADSMYAQHMQDQQQQRMSQVEQATWAAGQPTTSGS